MLFWHGHTAVKITSSHEFPSRPAYLKSIFGGILITGLLSSQFACNPFQTSKNEDTDVQAFSNRPQSYDRFVAILKLSSPPLLQKASLDQTTGKIRTPQDLVTTIEDEQDKIISELKTISSAINIHFKYRLVLNGLMISGPKQFEDKIRGLGGISYVESNQQFERLNLETSERSQNPPDLSENNSASYIGAYKIRESLKAPRSDGSLVPVDGSGTKVGVIDTGIDYTHRAFGGIGTKEAFEAQNKTSLEDGGFPNAKVVGGYDFVGTEYDSASPQFEHHIPKPDLDPMDEGGHGTHVAGTIAGLGDGLETYDGVSKGAELYALKVFGAKGSTNDGVVIAALEYSADPSGDLDLSDRLDVVNLSLGSEFGTPHVLYNEAMANLAKANVVIVASAGNSGNKLNIVGAPSTSDDSLSVAASIDQMRHNWQFRAVEFVFPDGKSAITEAVESSVSKPIAEDSPVSGPLVALGNAAADLTPEQKEAVKGKVALIDRGGVAFAEKIRRAAEAGAIGVVVVNNQPGDPFTMGGDGKFEIPAIMISQEFGNEVRSQIAQGPVTIQFVTPKKIEKPELIDTLTGFSSRGPRSLDGYLKPEIAAPGANIISAKMGAGHLGVKLSGTSMAAPHMAGVMALLRQLYPNLTVSELKSLATSTAVPIKDKTGKIYPLAYMGSGRVEAYQAATAPLTIVPATISLGELNLERSVTFKRTLSLSNISEKDVTFAVSSELDPGLAIEFDPKTVGPDATMTLKAKESKSLPLTITVTAPSELLSTTEFNGIIMLKAPGGLRQHVPLLGIVSPTTRITAQDFTIRASSPQDAAQALTTLTLTNEGRFSGKALLFNELDSDTRKAPAYRGPLRTKACDLETVGWRKVEEGSESYVEFAFKLYSPVTSWNLCEASILIDSNFDDIPDQELLGTALSNISGNDSEVDTFASLLTSAEKMRSIRRTYELQYPKSTTQNYSDAVVDRQSFTVFSHSTVAVVRAHWEKLAKTPSGDLRIKVAALGDPNTPDGDDFLGLDGSKWRNLTVSGNEAFQGLKDFTLTSGMRQEVELMAGFAPANLLVLLPMNPVSWSPTVPDQQKLSLTPVYKN